MPSSDSIQSFETAADLEAWFAENHETASEVWVRIFKKGAGKPSVAWVDCVVEAIAVGWIDGQKKPFDDESYLQRLTPRKPNSKWSKKNREHAERLIAEGRMKPVGRNHVDAVFGIIANKFKNIKRIVDFNEIKQVSLLFIIILFVK